MNKLFTFNQFTYITEGFNYKKDAFNAYIKGDINISELEKEAEKFGTEIITKKQLKDFLNNSFMISIMSDKYNIDAKQIKNKLKNLLKSL